MADDAMEEKTAAGTTPESKLKSAASMPLLPRPSSAGEDRPTTGKNAASDSDRTSVRPMGKAMSSFQMGEQAYDDGAKNPI